MSKRDYPARSGLGGEADCEFIQVVARATSSATARCADALSSIQLVPGCSCMLARALRIQSLCGA